MQEWTGIVIREEHYVTEGTWGWGDPYCKTRKRENYLHRVFYTNPPPPVSNDMFKVRTISGEDTAQQNLFLMAEEEQMNIE